MTIAPHALPRRRQPAKLWPRDTRTAAAPRRRKGWHVTKLPTVGHSWACADCSATGHALSGSTADHLGEAHWMAAHGEVAA